MTLVFGWRTAILAVTAATLLPLAWSMWRSLRNRVAARTLAACLVVLVGVFTPWMIGFAGFYDRWRWLTFAPLSNALLAPPLLYLHGHALTHGRWPARGWRHLAPGIAQFAYQTACFLLPMAVKERWASAAYSEGDVVVALLLAGSFALYGRAALRLLGRYRTALAADRSDDALFAGTWLTHSTIAFGAIASVWAGCLLWNAVSPLGYFGLMPLYAAIAGFALYLGIAGWRFLALPFPTFADLAPPAVSGATRDWSALGMTWGDASGDKALWTIERHGDAALLTMPNWAVYDSKWDWKGWLDAAIDRLVLDKIPRLVVDLRGNEGGEDCGNLLVARLIEKPTPFERVRRLVRYRRVPSDLLPHLDTWDHSWDDWKDAARPYDARFNELVGPDWGTTIIEPKGKRYTGKVEILIGPQNSSATYQFADLVQRERLATLIGEPTGGNRRGINGGCFYFLRLPETGLEVDLPLIGLFPTSPQPDQGVTPDVMLPVTREQIASGIDRQLEHALAGA